MEELEAHKEVDENIGGGKAQNTYNNPVETKLIKYERDERLQKYIRQRDLIKLALDMFGQERRQVFSQLYRGRLTAEGVAMVNHISRMTVFRWRDELKKQLREYNVLGE